MWNMLDFHPVHFSWRSVEVGFNDLFRCYCVGLLCKIMCYKHYIQLVVSHARYMWYVRILCTISLLSFFVFYYCNRHILWLEVISFSLTYFELTQFHLVLIGIHTKTESNLYSGWCSLWARFLFRVIITWTVIEKFTFLLWDYITMICCFITINLTKQENVIRFGLLATFVMCNHFAIRPEILSASNCLKLTKAVFHRFVWQ